MVGTEYIGSCKSNYQPIMTMTTPRYNSEHRELYSNMDMRIEYTIFLMVRLKSFRPEIDKKLAAPERMPKIK
jgi:hypothetical protein